MSADLRQKLEALESEVAHEARHQREREADSEFEEKFKHYYAAGKLEEVLASIRDLLASHEEREGDLPACPSCGETDEVFVKDPLVRLGCYRCGPYWREPWQKLLRSHTDREPDGWLWGRRDDDLDGYGIAWDREFVERHGHREDLVFRPIYIGPPIQPEEES